MSTGELGNVFSILAGTIGYAKMSSGEPFAEDPPAVFLMPDFDIPPESPQDWVEKFGVRADEQLRISVESHV